MKKKQRQLGKFEADKQNLRLQGLNALSGLIGQVSGLISAGVEEGSAAAKAAFVAMQAIPSGANYSIY